MQPPALEDVQRAIGDRYQLLSAVGAGGMGFVYSARHVTLGNVVAVKVLPLEVAASEMRLRRFQQEAALAASLDRKSTRLNSSHVRISYAVFCLKKKKTNKS